jgi:hypothetical protein
MTKLLDKKLIVTTNFKGLSQDALLDKMQAIVNNLAKYNADFPNPSPPTAEVQAQLDALWKVREEFQTLRKQQQALTQQQYQMLEALTTVFVNRWAPYVQQQADGDAAKVLETGFGIKGNEDGKGEHSLAATIADSYPLSHQIDTQIHLQHTLYFINSVTTRKAKPADADRIEIFEQISDTRPQSLNGMKYVGSTSKPVFINHFDASDAGKTVYYAFRYVNTQNKPGIESPIQSAIITH